MVRLFQTYPELAVMAFMFGVLPAGVALVVLIFFVADRLLPAVRC